MADINTAFLLKWDYLSLEDMQKRIDWLRASLEPGIDWGFCKERKTCVLKTPNATVLYRLRWFEGENQQEDIPSIF